MVIEAVNFVILYEFSLPPFLLSFASQFRLFCFLHVDFSIVFVV